MQQYEIEMTHLAEKDLENIGDYIAFGLLNAAVAKNIVKGIREQINKLHYFPESHELDEDLILAKMGVHRTYYKEYKIFYIIEHEINTVYIIRILHMRVDSKTWLYHTFEIEK